MRALEPPQSPLSSLPPLCFAQVTWPEFVWEWLELMGDRPLLRARLLPAPPLRVLPAGPIAAVSRPADAAATAATATATVQGDGAPGSRIGGGGLCRPQRRRHIIQEYCSLGPTHVRACTFTTLFVLCLVEAWCHGMPWKLCALSLACAGLQPQAAGLWESVGCGPRAHRTCPSFFVHAGGVRAGQAVQ